MRALRGEGRSLLDIANITGRSYVSIKNLVARGDFPLPASPPKAYLPKLGERRRIARQVAAPEAVSEVLEQVYDDLATLGAKRSRPTLREKGGGLLVELAAPDLHIGKLAWAPETTWGHYDVRLAERVFTDAVDALVARAQGLPDGIEQFVFPIGNDLVQTDNLMGTTTAGTPVDSDSRYIKSFRRACVLMQWAVDRLREIAPVRGVIVPGNHDRLTAFHVGDVLAAYYRNVDGVSIDNAPTLRKYVRHGTCLLGFTHGSEEKEADLPLIMAVEAPEAWKETTHREWHIGHFHKMRERRFTAGDSFGGVRVRVLSALCAPDAWHAMRGYVGEQRSAEAYLWCAKRGYVGHFAHTIHHEREGVGGR